MTQLCRSASLTGFGDLARAFGLDPIRLAIEAGAPIAALSDPDLKIPAVSVGWMLETAAERAGAEDFGLLLAEKRRLSNLGAVGLIAREQPSLRKLLEVMVQYQWMQNPALSVHIEETSDIGVVRLDLARPIRGPSRQGIELSIGVLCRTVGALLGERWRPEGICFTHAPPRKLDSYRRILGLAPLFGQDFNGIIVSKADLDAPIKTADPDMARQIERYVEQLATQRVKSSRDEVGELVVLLLPTGGCTSARVAKHLGVDRRTIHRRLALEGTTFSELMDERRAELAQSLMSNGDRSLGAIAEHLGFSCASAFSHWFQRTHGCSARAFRHSLS